VRGKRADGTPILFGEKISKPVLFDPDSPELDRRARQTLNRVVRYAKNNGGRVFITGFVRNQGGDPRFQRRLSADRAQQVAQYLSARGVQTWIRYNGYGAYRSGPGRPQDRRVEVRWSEDEVPNLRRTRANAPLDGSFAAEGGAGL
jgi:outer membrane protein OmpA-like peptidoglycan-associated protein